MADEQVAERFWAPGDEIERANYGFSILRCLTVGLLEEDSAGTGTVMRPDKVRAYASRADFSKVEILPIDHDFGACIDSFREESRGADEFPGLDFSGEGLWRDVSPRLTSPAPQMRHKHSNECRFPWVRGF